MRLMNIRLSLIVLPLHLLHGAGAFVVHQEGYRVDSSLASAAPSDSTAASQLKERLLGLARQTDRGFRANASERASVRKLIFELSALNPTPYPASAYFSEASSATTNTTSAASLMGKWTLVFTDAPDITSLETAPQSNPLVQLGRIGQECRPPTISNVIEWKAPKWILEGSVIPDLFKGTVSPQDRRILQKVVTKGRASPEAPSKVQLDIAGLQLQAPRNPATSGTTTGSSLLESVTQRGLVEGLLERLPLDLQGPLQLPFGEFELLYLDHEMRITRTGQNFFAVNVRDGPETEWF